MQPTINQGGDDVVPATSSVRVSEVPQIEVVYYTDPLCSWSWAFEPQWRRLRYEFGDQLRWTYRMGGLIPDWQQYNDPLNDVSRPVQMGPQWHQVRAFSGMPFNERIWYEDPPSSSYPACVAFKAAEIQGVRCGEAYLRRLREAVMLERRNIARQEVLLALADELAQTHSSFDAGQFHQDLQSEVPVNAFRDDLMDVRWREIGRFPTLIVRNRTVDRAILIMGYRPYEVLRSALADLVPDIKPQRTVDDVTDYVAHWGCLTQRELEEPFDGDQESVASAVSAVADRLECSEIPDTRHVRWRAKP